MTILDPLGPCQGLALWAMAVSTRVIAGPSEPLLIAATGLSLVYSFQAEDISEGHEAELFRLGAAVGKSSQEMFQSAAELRRRGLVQRRGVWGAVLPQAIANRLAARALQDIPAHVIEKYLVNDAPERIVKSFSRRLGYLDGSPEAQQIVRGWLGVGGLLEDILELNELGRDMFRNIASVDPEATLSALERAVLASPSDESATKCALYVPLLVSLAYEARHFERSIRLLTRIAIWSRIVKNVAHRPVRISSFGSPAVSTMLRAREQKLPLVF